MAGEEALAAIIAKFGLSGVNLILALVFIQGMRQLTDTLHSLTNSTDRIEDKLGGKKRICPLPGIGACPFLNGAAKEDHTE